jgi:dTDP-4-dehydrorhamnose reductase
VNSGHATWYQVAWEAARLLRVQPRLKAMTTAEAKFAAVRPRFCALSNRKLAGAGFDMPAWQDALQRWLAARSPAPRGVEGLAPSGVEGPRRPAVRDGHIE